MQLQFAHLSDWPPSVGCDLSSEVPVGDIQAD